VADGNGPGLDGPGLDGPSSDGPSSDGPSSDGTGFAGARQRTTGTPARRSGPDPVSLLVGLLALGLATAAFIGEVPDLSGLDARWLLAGGTALVGLLLLVGSLRARRG